jgi:NitT/TauT family transport system substrate-binding protein
LTLTLPRLSVALFLGATLCLLGGCGKAKEPAALAEPSPSGAPALTKVRFQLDWYPTAEHGGHFQALLKGYYKEAGLDVTIYSGGPGSYPLQKVAIGDMDMAMGRCDDVITAAARGIPVLVVGAQMEHDPQALMVHAEGPVHSFPDLDGKSIMCEVSSAWVPYLQGKYGIHFTTIPGDYGMGRFIADKTLVQACFISNEPFYLKLQGVKTRVLLIADGGFDPYRVLLTSRRFAREHPEAVRGFLAATIRGYNDFLHGDSSEARAKIMHEDPSQSPALMDYTIETLKTSHLVEGNPAKGEQTGLITPRRMQDMVKILSDLKIVPADLPLDKFVSFDFLPPNLQPPAK